MPAFRTNNDVEPLNRATLFNLPPWWVGRPMHLLRLDTIVLNLAGKKR